MRALLLLLSLFSPALTLAAAPQPEMLTGNLSSVGSDTLGTLMMLWSEDFSARAPGVNLQVQASGSSTAPTALAAGAAQLGPMSRPMQAEERQTFQARYGYPPLAVPVALDALVVVVNQRNPLKPRAPGAFSSSRRCATAIFAPTWQSFPARPPWCRRSPPIRAASATPASVST